MTNHAQKGRGHGHITNFITRRHASTVYAVVMLIGYVLVCVTPFACHMKPAILSITYATLHDSSEIRVFCCRRTRGISNGVMYVYGDNTGCVGYNWRLLRINSLQLRFSWTNLLCRAAILKPLSNAEAKSIGRSWRCLQTSSKFNWLP